VSESTSVGDELHGDPFRDAWQRLQWANRDGQSFADRSKWFAKMEAYAVEVERQGNRWEATWRSLIEPEVEAKKFNELARRFGSFLDHTRAALNYATYQLAQLALRKDPTIEGLDPNRVEFPNLQRPQ
jgi:hypothetical protein